MSDEIREWADIPEGPAKNRLDSAVTKMVTACDLAKKAEEMKKIAKVVCAKSLEELRIGGVTDERGSLRRQEGARRLNQSVLEGNLMASGMAARAVRDIMDRSKIRGESFVAWRPVTKEAG